MDSVAFQRRAGSALSDNYDQMRSSRAESLKNGLPLKTTTGLAPPLFPIMSKNEPAAPPPKSILKKSILKKPVPEKPEALKDEPEPKEVPPGGLPPHSLIWRLHSNSFNFLFSLVSLSDAVDEEDDFLYGTSSADRPSKPSALVTAEAPVKSAAEIVSAPAFTALLKSIGLDDLKLAERIKVSSLPVTQFQLHIE